MNDRLSRHADRSRRQRTITRDLTLSLVLAVLLSSALASTLVYAFVYFDTRQKLETITTEYLVYLSDSLALPVWSLDEEGVRRIAESFLRGELVAMLRITDQASGQVVFEAIESDARNLVVGEQAIRLNNDVIGQITIGLTPRAYQRSLHLLIWAAIGITLFVVLVLVLLTRLVLNRFWRRPMEALMQGIDRISKGDYTYQFPAFAQAEIQAIVAKFHFMADQIRTRQQSLEKMNLTLEKEVHERQGAENSLRDSHQTLLTVLDGIEAVIHVTDLKTYEILFSNKYMQVLYGENLVGRKCWEVLRNSPGPCAECRTDKLLNADNTPGPVQIYEDLNPVSGRWFIHYDRAIKWLDGRYVLLEMATDITAMKKMEAERRQTEAQLQTAQRLEAIGTLAGGVAHDFNNLLMGIQGNISLLLEEPDLSGIQIGKLEEIKRYVKRSVELTRQLLGIARGGKYEVRPVDINRLLGRTLEMFSRTRKEISLNLDLAEDLPAVEADRGQIEQVFLNLFVNAWQAMPGGGDLTVTTRPATVAKEHAARHKGPPGDYVCIVVQDNGTGMDAATQERIFDPFFTTKGIGSGTGLGLASAYGIITNHQGFIEVESSPGEGSIFRVYLPLSNRVALEEAKERPERATGTETVLLVDDEEMILDVGRQMLQKLGYSVLTAQNGGEAEALYRRHRDGIDLVVLDMIMPETGGAQVFDTLKGINPNLKVLLSSGYSLNGQASEILARGCNGFIQKPFDLDSLSQKIREILDV